MSKKILLVRHAKSDWADLNLSDFNRPLNPRGLKDSVEMAGRVAMQKLIPQRLVSSPALRAISTCELMAKSWNKETQEIDLEPKIYEANTQQLLKIVNNFDNNDDYIALFGHNNGITDLAVYLTDADLFNIPTCGVALIEFPFDDWKEVSKHNGDLVAYDYPKHEA
ncbi:SixA phosphatase family protein [Pedobacter arcticus]|uniref:SixA phosphatase family protein n=1 Tax=Pedobacter arcticus TaxID=752140 RepID=UPI0002EA8B6C|nr:histidine phosphatase family protein [Pedobacter arcticus]